MSIDTHADLAALAGALDTVTAIDYLRRLQATYLDSAANPDSDADAAERRVRMAAECQRMYLALEQRLEEARKADVKPIVYFWSDEQTDHFLARHIGTCPARFPR